MIIGIGTDMVKVERLAKSVERYGDRFVKKIFTGEEVQHCQNRADSIGCLAKRFAAKEAFVKALGTGMAHGIWFTDIQVIHDSSGRPGLSFSGEVQRRLSNMGPMNVHLSLSDEKEFAIAFVILEMRHGESTK